MSNTNSNTTASSGRPPGSLPACAACNLHHRKCSPDCPLAPYFPAHEPKKFLIVKKIFGLNRVLELLKKVDPSQQRIAMNVLIAEATIRAKDPVGGIHRKIFELERQIQLSNAELALIRDQLHVYRALDDEERSPSSQQNPPNVGESFINAEPEALMVFNPMRGLEELPNAEQQPNINSQVQEEPSSQHYHFMQNPLKTKNLQEPVYVDQALRFDEPSRWGTKLDMGSTPSSSSSSMVGGKQHFVDDEEEQSPLYGLIFQDDDPFPFDHKFKESTHKSRDKTVLKSAVDFSRRSQK